MSKPRLQKVKKSDSKPQMKKVIQEFFMGDCARMLVQMQDFSKLHGVPFSEMWVEDTSYGSAYDTPDHTLMAYRRETPEEVTARLEELKGSFAQRHAAELDSYEKGRREFERLKKIYE